MSCSPQANSNCALCEPGCQNGVRLASGGCGCACDEGWAGFACDTNACQVSASSAREVLVDNYVSVATHTKFLIRAGGVFAGNPPTRNPTHQHSDYIVLNGGSVSCHTPGALGEFTRIWVQAGGSFDTGCVRSSGHTTLHYEEGATIT